MRLRLLVLVVVIGTGCAVPAASPEPGSQPATDTVAAGKAVASDDAGVNRSSDAQDPDPASVDEEAGTSPPPTGTPGDEPAASPAPERSGAPAQEQPASRPSPEPLEFEVTLSSTCVSHGDEMTIEVAIEPDASVAYHAVYAGEEGGAVPPYGEGHGGNDGGPADGDGRYVDTWVVGPKAPEGSARVDVAVAYYGQLGRTEVAFEVADRLTGTCGGAD